jgi:hypothetical protein
LAFFLAFFFEAFFLAFFFVTFLRVAFFFAILYTCNRVRPDQYQSGRICFRHRFRSQKIAVSPILAARKPSPQQLDIIFLSALFFYKKFL